MLEPAARHPSAYLRCMAPFTNSSLRLGLVRYVACQAAAAAASGNASKKKTIRLDAADWFMIDRLSNTLPTTARNAQLALTMYLNKPWQRHEGRIILPDSETCKSTARHVE